MNANCTRCSSRACALAPTSSSVTGCPGTGSGSASAGRWMPRARLMLKSPAASAAPVPPAHTSACARPSATARAACTIEASGFARAARAGSGLLAIDSGASTSSTPATEVAISAGGVSSSASAAPSSARGPNSSTRAPCCAASAAPAATSAGPRSAPLASTATTGGSVVVVVLLVMLDRDGDLATGVCAAHPAHPVRAARAVAARAHAQRGRGDFVLRAALGGAAVRLLLLGDCHRTGKASSPA